MKDSRCQLKLRWTAASLGEDTSGGFIFQAQASSVRIAGEWSGANSVPCPSCSKTWHQSNFASSRTYEYKLPHKKINPCPTGDRFESPKFLASQENGFVDRDSAGIHDTTHISHIFNYFQAWTTPSNGDMGAIARDVHEGFTVFLAARDLDIWPLDNGTWASDLRWPHVTVAAPCQCVGWIMTMW